MVEKYPNLKEEVCGSIIGREISSLLDRNLACLMRFGIGMSTFCFKRKESKQEKAHHFSYLREVTKQWAWMVDESTGHEFKGNSKF